MTHARSPMRALRAALFAAVCVTLAAVGHSSMSAHDIPTPALLGSFGVTGPLAWLAGGRRRGVWTIGAGLLGVQGALHLMFAGAMGHGSSGGPGHDHAAMDMPMSDAAAMPGSEPTSMPMPMSMPMADEASLLHSSLGMLAAHLLAALVCALWLARGERAFFQLLRALGALAFTPLRLLHAVVEPPAAPRQGPPPRRRQARPRTAELAHAVSRRGPPRQVRPRRYAPTVA
ncbi:hypothetical protein [Streptomyces sp. NBC_01304]|uniref:hypothetical protein n=1 Tax=Streptomyces sp. NBC_01304 TaxID=2903818 RepID=UPI002E15D872|nr:hypothetical protein OG430_34655 [Streptomyces sp. NBC_01304]